MRLWRGRRTAGGGGGRLRFTFSRALTSSRASTMTFSKSRQSWAPRPPAGGDPESSVVVRTRRSSGGGISDGLGEGVDVDPSEGESEAGETLGEECGVGSRGRTCRPLDILRPPCLVEVRYRRFVLGVPRESGRSGRFERRRWKSVEVSGGRARAPDQAVIARSDVFELCLDASLGRNPRGGNADVIIVTGVGKHGEVRGGADAGGPADVGGGKGLEGGQSSQLESV